MTRQHILLALNVFLATVILAVLLGCGCDPADPPKGSLAEKLCGGRREWTSDPVTYTEIGEDGKMIEKTTRTKLDFSYWDYGMRMCYSDVAPSAPDRSCSRSFTYAGNTATADPKDSGDHSKWTILLDDQDPKVLYATWILKDGTTRLDRVRFKKDK